MLSESSIARFRSKVSSPGMPKTYSTPSASRHSTNRSAALRSVDDMGAASQLLPLPGVSPNVTSSPVRPTRIHLGAAAALTLACAPATALPAPAQAAKTRLTIRGAGFGHGVGMSQYGAYGFALEGADHREILGHYYSGTALAKLEPGTERVLLQASLTRGSFDGASRAGGRRVSPAKRYGVRLGPAGTVDLLSPTGRRLARVAAPLTVTGPDGVVRLRG